MKAFLCIVWSIVALVMAAPFFASEFDVSKKEWTFIFGYVVAWIVMAILLRIVFAAYPGGGNPRSMKAIYFWSGILITGASTSFFYRAYKISLTGDYFVAIKGHPSKGDAINALVNFFGNMFGPYGASMLHIFFGCLVACLGIFCVRKHI